MTASQPPPRRVPEEKVWGVLDVRRSKWLGEDDCLFAVRDESKARATAAMQSSLQNRPYEARPLPESIAPQPPPRREHPLEQLRPKPRTTVKRFAADLKERIGRASVAFDQPGQNERVDGMRYVLGIVDAALSDYDVRDPGDPSTPPPRRVPEEKAEALGRLEEDQLRCQLDAANTRACRAEWKNGKPYSALLSEVSNLRAQIEALRRENAELRKALEAAQDALEVAANAMRCGRMPKCADKAGAEAERAQAALRAAEKAPEAREPDDLEDPREVGYPPAPEAREPAPPAAEGLTAAELRMLATLLDTGAWLTSVQIEQVTLLRGRVRAAAEKAGGQ